MTCSNYWEICIPSKVYTQILDSWVRRAKRKVRWWRCKGAFGQGRRCVDHIFIISHLSEKVLERNKQMLIACIDCGKGTWYGVDRDRLWQVPERYGIWEVLSVICYMYLGNRVCVHASGKMSEWSPITQGVRQGCVVLPWLFNVFIDGIMREEKENLQGGVQLTTTNVRCYSLWMIQRWWLRRRMTYRETWKRWRKWWMSGE